MRKDESGFMGPLMAVILVSSIVLGAFGFSFLAGPRHDGEVDENDNYVPGNGEMIVYDELDTFEDFGSLRDYLEMQINMSRGQYTYYYYYPRTSSFLSSSSSSTFTWNAANTGGAAMMAMGTTDNSYGGESSYSSTNIQVEGVDEGDIVKNDARFAYIVSSNNQEVIIMDVYPPQNARVIGRLAFDGYINSIYLRGEKLVVQGTPIVRDVYEYGGRTSYYNYSERGRTIIKVYDIEAKTKPVLDREVVISGSYVSSRAIGNYLYVITNMPIGMPQDENALPVPADEIHYLEGYDTSYTLTNITSINVQDPEEETKYEILLMGRSNEIYVSTNNIYISYRSTLSYVECREIEIEYRDKAMLPPSLVEEINATMASDMTRWEKVSTVDKLNYYYYYNLTSDEKYEFSQERYRFNYEQEEANLLRTERTTVHKVAIHNGDITYVARGSVPGRVLNRFSMDEHSEHFRMATTTGHVSRSGASSSVNQVFVLNHTLDVVGQVDDIAPGERIYSARFMGNRGYIVTFKKVDPFFVIDLTEPTEPRILGELKIPGFSNYLHPYDENHVIGIGKETVESDTGTFAWFQGVKISLFDVTNVMQPKELDKYVIGDRGTSSPAEYDPHAFLFDRAKHLLVIPIYLYEKDSHSLLGEANTCGEHTFSGAYVLDISLRFGIRLKGRITHVEGEVQNEYSYYYGGSSDMVERSFFIGEVLYTVSDKVLKANALRDLTELKKVPLDG